jgi:hypothetical protein
MKKVRYKHAVYTMSIKISKSLLDPYLQGYAEYTQQCAVIGTVPIAFRYWKRRQLAKVGS